MRESERERNLRALEQLTQLMDDRFQVPGTNIRFGLDGLIGLVPGIGDLAGAGISLYIVYHARRHGASRWLIGRMLGNVAVDTVIGAIPLVGDAFDIGFKANRRNMRLLKRHLERQSRDQR